MQIVYKDNAIVSLFCYNLSINYFRPCGPLQPARKNNAEAYRRFAGFEIICYNFFIKEGPLAQLLEQTPLKRKVTSSSLVWPTSILNQLIQWTDGGIGRRVRLRTVWIFREGSSPSPSIVFCTGEIMSSFAVAQDNEVKTKEISKKGCTVVLEVTAEPSLVNKCFHNALLQVQAKAQMQGFRAGKVPLDIVKKNFVPHITERAADLVIRNASSKALEKSELKAVMAPAVTKADFSTFGENKAFSFEMSVDVAPEFKVKGYKGIAVTKKSETVSEEDVNKHLNEVLEHNSSLEAEAEGAAVGDNNFVVVKYSGSKDGKADKKYSSDGELVDMSAPQTVAGLADAIKGAKKGESRTFDAKIDDGTINFTVQVEEIKKKVKPELNDAFAKDMGFDNVEKLKETVKTSMEREAKTSSERDVVKQIEDALVKENGFDLPSGLVEYYTQISVANFINRMFGGKNPELSEENKKAFAERMRPGVERDLRIGYIVHAIAEAEKLEATEEDWKAELDKALASQPKEEANIKKFFNDRKDEVMATINERKVFDFLKSNAKIK